MSSTSTKPIYLGIGNPLLDITVQSDEAYLQRFGLKRGTAVLAEASQLPIYPECEARKDVQFCAGGSSMNTARALQWMLQLDMPHATAFVGCIGRDPSGDTLRRAVVDAGVQPLFLTTDAAPTGKCAVLVTDKERTLVTNLGAAEHYKLEHLQQGEGSVPEALASAQTYYAEGFFATVSTPALVALGERALREGKTFMFNISAPFLVEFFWDRMSQVMPLVDYIFCNETEAQCVAKKLGWPLDLEEIVSRMATLPKQGSRPRTAVITHGSEETLVCVGTGQVQKFRPIKVPREDIVDTNGAGDSFVGGFLSQFVRGQRDIARCVAAGHYCAWKCLHNVGCRFSGLPDFK